MHVRTYICMYVHMYVYVCTYPSCVVQGHGWDYSVARGDKLVQPLPYLLSSCSSQLTVEHHSDVVGMWLLVVAGSG